MRRSIIGFFVMSAVPISTLAASIQFHGPIPDYRVTCAHGTVRISFEDKVVFAAEGNHRLVRADPLIEVEFASPSVCRVWRDETMRSVVLAKTPEVVALDHGTTNQTSAAKSAAQPYKVSGNGDLASDLKSQTQKKTASEEAKAALKQLGVPPAALNATADDIRDLISNYSVNFSIPDSPGLHIVGLGTEEVARPNTPRALAVAIQPAVDKDGNVKRGLALDFAPFKILAPGTTKEAYKGWLVSTLWNTQVSVGTAKAADATDKTLKAGFGVHSILYRSKDPLRDENHHRCLTNALREELRDLKQTSLGGGGGSDPKDSKAAHRVAKCYKDLEERSRGGFTAAFALATSRFSESGKWSDGKLDAHGGWLSATYGLEQVANAFGTGHLEGGLIVKRLLSETVADPLDDKAKVKQSSWLFGTKLTFSADAFNYFAEYSYRRLQIVGRERDKVRRTAFGIEWEISPGMWLVAAIGGEGGRTNGKDNTFMTTGIKLGTSAESLLKAH
jgi:hypothetical protein